MLKTADISYIDSVRGKFLEYLFYNWMVETNKDDKTTFRCDLMINHEQIDCSSENGKEVNVFECKMGIDIRDVKDVIEQVKRKCSAVRRTTAKEVVGNVVSYKRIGLTARAKLESAGLWVIDDLDNLISSNLRYRNRKEARALLRRDHVSQG